MQSEFLHQWIDRIGTLIDRAMPYRRRAATICVFALALMFGYHVMFGANGMVVYQKKKSEYRNLQTEIQQMQEENDRLNSQIKALKSDPKAIEKEAREQLKYTKEGEFVFVIQTPKDQKRETISAEQR
jgi:cell division protein FtsB